MERKEGYYWVRYTDWSGEPKHHWYAAHWDGHRWANHAFPKQENTDDYWDEINETRIPTPDEEIARSQMYQRLLEEDRVKRALSDATALLRRLRVYEGERRNHTLAGVPGQKQLPIPYTRRQHIRTSTGNSKPKNQYYER